MCELMIQSMIAVIGSGSWATAIVKILQENSQQRVNWWARSREVADEIMATGHNPRHLPEMQLDPSRLWVSDDLQAVVGASDELLLAVPSAYIDRVLSKLPPEALKGHRIISAVKGTLPDCCMSISQYVEQNFGVQPDDICVVSGPSHAEEVAHGMPTYLTAASRNETFAREVADRLRNHYIITSVSTDIDGVERCGLAKNIYAIAAGIGSGLGYGDNLNAVLTAGAIREMSRLLEKNLPLPSRNILDNCYLGDLTVTCWSRHSRNRALGEAVARGEKAEEVFARTGSIAEGYYSVRNMHRIAKSNGSTDRIPIAEAVYRILYKDADPRQEMQHLIETVL